MYTKRFLFLSPQNLDFKIAVAGPQSNSIEMKKRGTSLLSTMQTLNYTWHCKWAAEFWSSLIFARLPQDTTISSWSWSWSAVLYLRATQAASKRLVALGCEYRRNTIISSTAQSIPTWVIRVLYICTFRHFLTITFVHWHSQVQY